MRILGFDEGCTVHWGIPSNPNFPYGAPVTYMGSSTLCLDAPEDLKVTVSVKNRTGKEDGRKG